MKKSLIYLFIIIQYSAFAQTEKNSFDFKKVYDIAMTKEQLKENTNAWMVKTFTNTNNGIKLTSTDNLLARGRFDGYFLDGIGVKKICHYELIIEASFKENKYRLVLSDFEIKPKDENFTMQANWGMMKSSKTKEEFIQKVKEFCIKHQPPNTNIMLKRLNKPKKLIKDMNAQKKNFDAINSQILAQQKSISKSLFNYLEKKKESDW